MWAAGNELLALFVGCPVLAQVLRSCIQGIWWDPTCNYIRVPSEELAIRRGTHTPSPCSHTKGSQTKSLFFPKIKIFWKGPILLELLLSGSALSDSSNIVIITSLSLWTSLIGTPLVNSVWFTFMEGSGRTLVCKSPPTVVLSGWQVSWYTALNELSFPARHQRSVLSPSSESRPCQLELLKPSSLHSCDNHDGSEGKSVM